MPVFFVLLFLLLAPPSLTAQQPGIPAPESWRMESGGVEFILRHHEDQVLLDYLGPAGAPRWVADPKAPARYAIAGLVDGQGLSPEDLTLVSHQFLEEYGGSQELRLVFRHRRLPLEIEETLSAWGRTGVFTRKTKITSQGDRALRVESLPSVQLAYGCALEFTPEACNHWMVGDDNRGHVNLKAPSGWWDFLLRVPMNGQYGISSRVFDWSPALKERAAGVLMAYRLSAGRPQETFRLRGLAADAVYQIRSEGRTLGSSTGRQLAEQGWTVSLDAEWRAAVIELMK